VRRCVREGAGGALLGKIERSVSWWLGDWWAFGEARYGERKAIVDAEDWEGLGFGAVDAVLKHPVSRRRKEYW
jgi:hypothetical protein